jgi:hypothetical protein
LLVDTWYWKDKPKKCIFTVVDINQIKFKNMKKYIVGAVILGLAGLASLAFADDDKRPEASRSPKPEVTITSEARSCIKNAIDKRDSAIISTVDKFSSSVKSALSKRKDALKSAWDKSTKSDIRLALRMAWDDYNKSARDARKALNTDRKAAWSQYKTDSRTCRPSVEDRQNEGSDSQL